MFAIGQRVAITGGTGRGLTEVGRSRFGHIVSQRGWVWWVDTLDGQRVGVPTVQLEAAD